MSGLPFFSAGVAGLAILKSPTIGYIIGKSHSFDKNTIDYQLKLIGIFEVARNKYT